MANQERAGTLFEQLRRRVHDLLYEECPPTEAPTFASTLPEPDRAKIQDILIAPGAVVISGVALPQNVVTQLRELGLPLTWYTHGELEDAVIACAYDTNLIDDDEGINFEDKLHMTDEKEARELRKLASEIGAPVRILNMHTLGLSDKDGSAADLAEKMTRVRAAALGLCGPEPIPFIC